MKKLNYFFMLLIFAALGLSSCTDDTEDLKKQIAELQKKVDGLEPTEPEKVDLSSLESAIAEIQSKLALLEGIKTPEDFDVKSLSIAVSTLQTKVKGLETTKPEKVDLSSLEADIADLQSKLALLEGIETPEDADLSSLTLALSKLIENLKQNPNYYWDANFAERLKSSVSGQENKHDYVDLGLPSKTLWATCNIGAENPEDYGNYYAWGETEPQEDNAYSRESYKFYKEDKENYYGSYTKYNDDDELTELEEKDDVAHVKWGGNWRMPSEEQLQELIDNCGFYWKESMPRGYFVESKKNGNVIFLPAAGSSGDGDIVAAGSDSDYRSRSLNPNDASYAFCLYFDFRDVNYHALSHRTLGQSVRAVCEIPKAE